MKWWPGDLGLFSTHALVFARLITKGKDHGVHSFFVQIRDFDSHIPLEGVEVGDIGPKMGYGSKDNGFLRLNNVKAPKISLLGKFISVDNKGNVTTRGNPKVMYASMMYMRTGITGSSYYNLMKAAVIGIRYSVQRKQFKDSEEEEIPIIKYQMQK